MDERVWLRSENITHFFVSLFQSLTNTIFRWVLLFYHPFLRYALINPFTISYIIEEDILFSIDGTAGHLGVIKTYDNARRRFYWPKMFCSVQRYVNRCLDCQTKKPAPGLISLKSIQLNFPNCRGPHILHSPVLLAINLRSA